MNIATVSNAVTRVGGRGALIVKKYSPQILTGMGIVSGVASTVLASKATLKAQPIVEESKEYIELVRENKEGMHRSEYGKELTFAYGRVGLKLARVYGPAISVGSLGILCVVSAQGIMQQRNAALSAAYVAAEKAFAEYRKRVEAALGSEQEAALRYGITKERRDDTKKGEVSEDVIVDPNAVSLYAKFFDEYNQNWSKDPEYNMVFLKSQQQMANDLLHARGHVLLNDVYDALGIERTKAGAVVGWVLSKDGDNFIDFGLLNGKREAVREFVNGRERSILLDFNVDGIIYDRLP